jgi:arginine decarboxylase
MKTTDPRDWTPRYMFFTKGVGRHRERLTSFEEALRNARIANYNLVHVSSIFPPFCKVIPQGHGITLLQPGQVVFCVMARQDTNENGRLVATSIGLAIPRDPGHFGYLSEHHSYGETNKVAGDYAEDLAASMLATVLGVDFDVDASWDKKKEIYRISDKIVRSMNITQSAIGKKGVWTTTIAAAVLIL